MKQGNLDKNTPIFVVAPARSGTTTLSHQIAKVFDVQCSPETNFISIAVRIRQNAPNLSFREFEEIQSQYLMHGKKRKSRIKFPASHAQLDIIDHLKNFCELVISAEKYTDGQHVLEQTPRNGEQIQVLNDIFPTSPIIFICRNPFDTIQSLRNTPWGNSKFFVHLVKWARQHYELIVISRKLGRKNHIKVVRYEKFGNEQYITSIFKWLDKENIVRRVNPIAEIIPINHADSTWAAAHFEKSTTKIQTPNAEKWTNKYPKLKSLGNAAVMCTILAYRGNTGLRLSLYVHALRLLTTISKLIRNN